MPPHAFCTCTNLCTVARCSLSNLNERHEDAVGSQQQFDKSAVRSPRAPRGRRVYVAGTYMIATGMPLCSQVPNRREGQNISSGW